MARDIDATLAAYGESDYSVRLVRGLCSVVPFGPDLPMYSSLADLIKQTDAKSKQPQLDRLKGLIGEAGPQKALWVAGAMDTADSGITAVTGVATVVRLYQSKQGERMGALETDQQQAADAVLKGLAIAYLIWTLFPGGPTEKVAAFRALPSGQAMLFYYGVVELGLPFADNALTSGGGLLQDLFQKYGPDQHKKLAAVAGDEAAGGAVEVMRQLAGPIDTLVQTASGHLSTLAGSAVSYLPTALDVGDKAAGMAATAADALPVYTWLGSRVVAEACAKRALAEVPVDKPAGGAAAAKNPALDEVKYTTKKPGKDEIVVPQTPARTGCLGWFGMFVLAAIGASWGMS